MNKPRVFVVHGWEESPEAGWFPWLKGELVKVGLDPHILEMPTPIWPQIDTWVKTLAGSVHQPDNQTFFVGHSVGCQTILRYLETIPENSQIGGLILVAGWVTLKPAALEDEEAKAIADPWLHRPLHWTRIKARVPKAVAVASDDDPYVPMEDQHIFRQQLHAKVIVERSRGHLGGADGVMQLPVVLRELQAMTH